MQLVIDVRDEMIQHRNSEIATMQATINALNEDNKRLRETGFVRKFKLTPNKLSVDEQKTIGKYVDTPILRLISKWFEEKADENNQMLLHAKQEDNGQSTELWKLATLVYEDWMMLMNHCAGTFKREQDKIAKQKENR